MLTVLTIDDKTYKGKWGRIVSAISLDSLKVQTTKSPVEIRCVKYINRRGKINWKKIEKAVLKGRGVAIYSGEPPIPESTGIKIFEPVDFRKRLCTNMALAVLDVMKVVPKALRIGLYDPAGECADLPEHLLRYTDNLIIVTKNYDVYREQAQRLLCECGAVLSISPHTSLLSSCGLIISPAAVDAKFTPMTNSVVLSGCKPSVSLPCRVYYRYSFSPQKELTEFKPDGIDAEIFAGALYSFCGFYTLGSVVPLVCMGEYDTQTTLSLRRYLTECFGT